jgi:hypothetical protein
VLIPKCHPGIWEGCEWRKAVRGILNRWVTSEGLRTGFNALSVTRRTTLEGVEGRELGPALIHMVRREVDPALVHMVRREVDPRRHDQAVAREERVE